MKIIISNTSEEPGVRAKQILKCSSIVSPVPYSVKAKAVFDTLTSDVRNRIPATALKSHGDVTLFLDKDSSSLVDVKSYE